MTPTALYCRVSTEGQSMDGVSMSQQESHLVSLYPDAVRFLEHGTSAGKPMRERPQGALLIEAVERGEVKQVVAVSLSRLFRSASEALTSVEHWERLGVSLRVLDLGIDTSTPIGKFALTILAAIAEMELSQIRHRTKTAMRFLKSEHGSVSPRTHRPVGNPRAYQVQDVDAEILEILRGRTNHSAAKALNARGLMPGYGTAQGLPWDEERCRSLRRALRKKGVAV